MTININNYTRVRYGNTETVQAHQRGDAHKPIPHESGYYFSDRQINIMNRK
jgi:hypothetical protein